MNKVHRIVWSASRNDYVVAHEHAGTAGKPSSTCTAAVASALLLGLSHTLAWADPASNALPTGGQIAAGSGSISTAGNAMTVQQSSDKLIANWQSFNIGSQASVTFKQPGSSSVALNRVLGQDPSQILGRLNANGQVMLVNPAGIVFGAGSQINVGGITASTLSLSDADFLAGRYHFSDSGNTAAVQNLGHILANGGVVALVAPVVKNEGTIDTPHGSTALAAGQEVSLDFSGDGLVTVTVSQSKLDALVQNKGAIRADEGVVILTAGAASELLSGAVNNSGIVEAKGLSQQGGRIVLEGRTVANTGTLDVGSASHDGGSIAVDGRTVMLGGDIGADGAKGGHIDVHSEGLLSLADQVHARGTGGAGGNDGQGGTIQYQAQRIIETSTGSTDASGTTHGGSIRVNGGSQFASSGHYRADGAQGDGGRIDLTADSVSLLSAQLSAKGAQNGGLIRMGGAFQGGKAPDTAQLYYDSFLGRWDSDAATSSATIPPIANANRTFINDTTAIDVSGGLGRGGTAVVWSNQQTTFLGQIKATGGAGGGSVELSSAGDLRKASLTGVNVGNGHLLLDPKDIVIGSAQAVESWSYAAIMGVAYGSSKSRSNGVLASSDFFGSAVSLNAAGDRLAVGAYGDDGSGNAVSGSGAVYLFSFTDTNFSGGTLQATLGKGYSGGKNVDVSALEANDNFGNAVALNAAGDRLAVGASQDDGSGNASSGSGAAYLFSFSDTSFTGGSLQATLGKGYSGGKNVDVSALEASDSFGWSVSLNAAGDRLAVGAYHDDGSGNVGTDLGAVHLFSFSDTSFTGGTLQATLGYGYSGGKNVDVSALETIDYFGSSVSLNAAGDRLAVGAYRDRGSGNIAAYSGAVYLFSFTDTSFSGGSLQATLGKGYSGGKNVDVSALGSSDFFGNAVSLNAAGDRLAVGAYQDDGNGNTLANSGAVYLFSFSDTSFSGGTLQATLGKGYSGGKNVDVSALASSDFFGSAVSLNATGDRLAVGAYQDDGNGNAMTNSGAVYLFSFTDTSFSGGMQQGVVGSGYNFTSSGKNVDVSALEANDYFGNAVSLNAAGNRLAVGAYGDDGSGNAVSNSGAVYLFSFSDTSFSGGALQATLGKGYSGGKNVDVSALESGDYFGFSVSLNAAGDRLAVGAVNDGGNGNVAASSGAAYLFSFTDTNFTGGTLQATLGKGYSGGKNVDVSALETSDVFGNAVSLNAAGDRLAVGAYGDDGNGNAVADSGAVYLFSFSDTNFSGGTLQATMGKGYSGGKNVDVSALEGSDYFGYSVSLNAAGDRLAVGAYGDDGSGNAVGGSGAVYLYSFADTSYSGGSLEATLGKGYSGGKNVDVAALAANDIFGSAVSLNAAGDRLAVGAMSDDGSGNMLTDSGAVYLFSFTDTSFTGGSLQATLGRGYSGSKDIDVSALDGSDYFGRSLSLNAAGDRLAVGAYFDDGSSNVASNSGGVYLFSFADTNFSGGVVEGTLGKGDVPTNKNLNMTAVSGGDSFGRSVSLNAAGDRLAVGAMYDDGSDNTITDSGAVYLFSFSDTSFSGGSLQATLGKGYSGGKNVDVTALESGDWFGTAVSLNGAGDRLAVSALTDGGSGNAVSNSGAVYLFSFTDTSFTGGSLQATLGKGYSGGKNVDVSVLEAGDQFGSAVSLNAAGDRLAVGVYSDAGSGNAVTNSGGVYLFSFTDTSFSGGALQATLGKGYSGGKNVDVTALEANDYFGGAVSLNAAGDRLAVGAFGDDGSGNAVSNSGAVYLFNFTDTSFTGGSLQATLGKGYSGGKNVDVTALEASDAFGSAVSLNAAGDRLAVGTPRDDGSGNVVSDSGAVHLFSFTDTSFSGGSLQATLGKSYTGGKNTDLTALAASDVFGSAVSINAAGDRMAVGAYDDDGSDNVASSSGAVYLFAWNGGNTSLGNAGSYSLLSGTSATVLASEVAAQLSTGADVTLKASNDITVSTAITANNGSGNGGALSLNAGRSILVNANITTDDGGLNLIANDTLANGVVDADRSAGAAAINVASGVTINAGTGAVQLLIRNGAGKTYTASDDITVAGAITAGSITLGNAGPTAGSGVVLNSGASLTASGTGTAIDLYGDGFINNAGSSALSAASGRWLVWSTDPASDTRGGLTYGFKQYNATHGSTTAADTTHNGFLYTLAPTITASVSGTISQVYNGSTTATVVAGDLSASGAVDSDTVTLAAPSSASFDTKNVGSSKTVTATGVTISGASNGSATVYGYQMASATATGAVGAITAKTLTLSGFDAANKTYDATTTATINNAGSLVGVESGDTVTASNSGATFANKNIGTGKTVTLSGVALGGADAGNYTIASTATDTADITAKTLTLSGFDAANKTYDATTTATINNAGSLVGVETGDTVTVSNSGATFANKNVATGKTVTLSGVALGGADAGNYTIANTATDTADITAKTVTVSGITASNKTYDGTTAATVDTTGASFTGKISGDSLSASATGVFNNKNAATGKTVTLTSSYGGTDVGNYTFTDQASTTADITAKAVTVSGITANNKTYDGTTTATVDSSGAVFTGKISGDSLSASSTGVFSNKNAANGKTVTLTSSYGGTDVGNYTFTDQASTTANITAKAVTVSGITSNNKTYDGTTAATVDTTGASFTGKISGDSLSASTTGVFNNKNAATGKTVTLTSAYGGTDVGNYTFTDQASTTADIAAKAITVSGITASNKTYDGTTAATVDTSSASFTGKISGDSLSVSSTGVFNNKNAATGKSVTLTSAYGGADVGNYTFTDQASTTADITAKAVTVLGITASNKTYDGTTAATVDTTGASFTGKISGDNLSVATTGVFNNKNAATGKTVTLTSSYGGTDVGNYTFTDQVSATADIAAKAVTVSGITANNKTYDGTTSATVDTTGVSFTGKISGDSLSASATGVFNNKNAATGKTVTLTSSYGGTDVGNYTFTDQVSATADIAAKAVTVSGITASNKTYDGTTAATVDTTGASFTGKISGDNLSVTTTGVFNNKNSATGKTVTLTSIYGGTDVGNYTFTDQASTTADITAKAITVSGITANNKTYDGTTAAAVDSSAAVFTGKISGDSLSVATTGVFNNKNAATGKTVTLTSSYGGTDVGNYTFTDQVSATADIAAKAVTVSGVTASNKTYDGTTAAAVDSSAAVFTGKISGDSLSVATTGVFNNKNAATGKTVTLTSSYGGTDVGNYTFTDQVSATADIAAKAVTISGVTASNKTYDGTTAATVDTTGASFTGKISGDNLSVTTTGVFNNKNAATGKTVTLTSIYGGTDVGNYTFTDQASTTADITAKAITVSGITANNKTYDGTTTATVDSSGAVFTGKISGDSLSASSTGVFSNKNAANGKTVTLTCSYGGTDVGNYTFTDQASTTADITAKAITVSGITANNKTYEGTTAATVDSSGAVFTGKISGDSLSVSSTGVFNNKNAATGKTVTLTSAYGGADVGNYTFTDQVSATADIAAKVITVSGITASNKTYDGTTAATVDTSGASFTGQVNGDNLSVATTGVFNNKNAATGKTVTLTSAYGGADVGNYTFSDQASTTADIAAKAVTLTGLTAENKSYDGKTDAKIGNWGSLSGLVAGDDVTLSTGATVANFEDANPGTGKTVAVSSLQLAGLDSGNYSFTGQTSATADIRSNALPPQEPAPQPIASSGGSSAPLTPPLLLEPSLNLTTNTTTNTASSASSATTVAKIGGGSPAQTMSSEVINKLPVEPVVVKLALVQIELAHDEGIPLLDNLRGADPKVASIATVSGEGGLALPAGMRYDEASGRLYVTDVKGHGGEAPFQVLVVDRDGGVKRLSVQLRQATQE